MQNEIYEEIRSLCIKACQEEPTRLKIVIGEDDDNTNSVPDAGEFLKLDEKRCGCDFKLYNFMADVVSKIYVMGDFANVLMVLKSKTPKAFAAILEQVNSWEKFFPDEHRQGWKDLWS